MNRRKMISHDPLKRIILQPFFLRPGVITYNRSSIRRHLGPFLVRLCCQIERLLDHRLLPEGQLSVTFGALLLH